jgi:hypothetical protein
LARCRLGWSDIASEIGRDCGTNSAFPVYFGGVSEFSVSGLKYIIKKLVIFLESAAWSRFGAVIMADFKGFLRDLLAAGKKICDK